VTLTSHRPLIQGAAQQLHRQPIDMAFLNCVLFTVLVLIGAFTIFVSIKVCSSWNNYFSSHCHFHRCHSSSPHPFMSVSVNKNKPSKLYLYLFTGNLNIPTHLLSFITFSMV